MDGEGGGHGSVAVPPPNITSSDSNNEMLPWPTTDIKLAPCLVIEPLVQIFFTFLFQALLAHYPQTCVPCNEAVFHFAFYTSIMEKHTFITLIPKRLDALLPSHHHPIS